MGMIKIFEGRYMPW